MFPLDGVYLNCRYRFVLFVILAAGLFLLPLFSCMSAQHKSSKKDRILALYDHHEKECIKKGWQKTTIKVNGVERRMLWKGPDNRWQNGAIIALHGGGGTYSNFGSNIPLGAPMVHFSELAIAEGFAVFSLDSADGLAIDKNGFSCGKRWDCIDQKGRVNVDLPFIEKVMAQVIPQLRPDRSAEDIFITGISNGGFMTILAAIHFEDEISAFAPVSAGDPYGIFVDCSDTSTGRVHAPGRWYDQHTGKEIGKPGACFSAAYADKKQTEDLPAQARLPFKQFHHEGDRGVDISCMRKAQGLLEQHGFKNAGPFIVKNVGRKNIWKHFWLEQYNLPLIQFFKGAAKKRVE